MKTKTIDEPVDEIAGAAVAPIAPPARRPATDDDGLPQGAPEKQSYESSADVQRWLRDQALDALGAKPQFDPSYLAGRRDRLWILSSLEHFYQQDLISDVLYVLKSGKEATVYCCAGGPAAGADYLAAKIYRPRMFRSLRNDALYRESRQRRDERGRPLHDGRRQRGGVKGRADQVNAWIEYEFETHRLLYEAGAAVPRPVSQIGNAVLMEYIGGLDEPAPLLREVRVGREEAQPLFDELMRNVELFLACNRLHGDLSAFNILYWQGRVTIIDFAQAVDPRHNPEIYPVLERDVERVYRYFARYGVVADPGAIAAGLWADYMGGGLW